VASSSPPLPPHVPVDLSQPEEHLSSRLTGRSALGVAMGGLTALGLLHASTGWPTQARAALVTPLALLAFSLPTARLAGAYLPQWALRLVRYLFAPRRYSAIEPPLSTYRLFHRLRSWNWEVFP
jgi:hypothetical protein